MAGRDAHPTQTQYKLTVYYSFNSIKKTNQLRRSFGSFKENFNDLFSRIPLIIMPLNPFWN